MGDTSLCTGTEYLEKYVPPSVKRLLAGECFARYFRKRSRHSIDSVKCVQCASEYPMPTSTEFKIDWYLHEIARRDLLSHSGNGLIEQNGCLITFIWNFRNNFQEDTKRPNSVASDLHNMNVIKSYIKESIAIRSHLHWSLCSTNSSSN